MNIMRIWRDFYILWYYKNNVFLCQVGLCLISLLLCMLYATIYYVSTTYVTAMYNYTYHSSDDQMCVCMDDEDYSVRFGQASVLFCTTFLDAR